MFNIPKYMDRMIGRFLFGFLGVEGSARDEKKKLKLGFNVRVITRSDYQRISQAAFVFHGELLLTKRRKQGAITAKCRKHLMTTG